LCGFIYIGWIGIFKKSNACGGGIVGKCLNFTRFLSAYRKRRQKKDAALSRVMARKLYLARKIKLGASLKSLPIFQKTFGKFPTGKFRRVTTMCFHN
jgi:hypothetical protein